MTLIIALAFKFTGVFFLLVATAGVLRFSDPFQRMHAATKAGTLGAGLVLLGAMLTKGSTEAVIVASLTVIILIATLPVAGHLLGRAAYVSGAPMNARTDALAGLLPRESRPLEERGMTSLAFAGPPLSTLVERPAARLERAPAPAFSPAPESREIPAVDDVRPGLDAVRFAIIAPFGGVVAARARAIATAQNAQLHAIAMIDRMCLEEARLPEANKRIRQHLANAILEVRRELDDGSDAKYSVSYEVGDPLRVIPAQASDSRELLVLPTNGWCHHGARITFPVFESRWPDKLFTLAEKHAGPTLFVDSGSSGRGAVVIVHDGGERLQRLAVWALGSRLWECDHVIIAGKAPSAWLRQIERAATDAGAAMTHLPQAKPKRRSLLPASFAHATAVVLPCISNPGRVDAYGVYWQDKIIPGFRGDVLA